jgi:threonine synthase
MGKIDEVTDDEILHAYQLIAREEGVFAEPGSCASIAGVLKQVKSGEIPKGSKVVAVLTGNGLKDPNTAVDISEIKPVTLPTDEDSILEYVKGAAVYERSRHAVLCHCSRKHS